MTKTEIERHRMAARRFVRHGETESDGADRHLIDEEFSLAKLKLESSIASFTAALREVEAIIKPETATPAA